MALSLRPITFRDACGFVKEHHRHHKPPQGHKGSVAVEDDGRLCGVAMVGRPVSRHLDDNHTAEVTRLCTDGTRNACSKLYAAAATLAKGFGYERVITYIREDEPGTSLKASGWKCLGEAGGGQWTCPSRPRKKSKNDCKKRLWEKQLGGTPNGKICTTERSSCRGRTPMLESADRQCEN